GNPHLNLIRISSLESPDAHLERSPRGLADRTWLEANRARYGEGSLWWTARVLARFPGSAADSVFSRDWVDAALARERPATHPPGQRYMAIDLGGGGEEGDLSVIVARDDLGLLKPPWTSATT